jgi:hypothetical protein
MSHTQPVHTYQYRGNTADRIETNGVDDTGYDYNVRVSPHSTEHFYGTPIRYNRADVRKPGWEGVTPGRKVVKLNDHDGRWMSKPTNEEGNSWYRNGYDSRLSHTIGIKGKSREGDWVSAHATKTNCTDHYKAGNNDSTHFLKYTPSLACVETATQTATDRTMEPRSNVWGKGGVSNSRSSHTIGKMEQSREGDWVSEHTSKPDRTDHKVAGDTDGERHIL